ncbi:CRISPR-associated helicase Cas3' [Oxalobacter aliiformigenes]|uniref:CRISPR-associated helicase Cas3' n=1 Tax=Oxalobacter aliiformigenes TaxID=2946593 RepID=UPI0022AF26AD|nr:CRISPR-associated helicase Cas3' [Oxalobacter aliiformigenes]MCZ4065025.1 CRISPR-associated helicase Cas3' [Oxalobacter aliiformigenes]WAW00076.1 CRISPR-associated helicase Cas3' [Oxalobacter aliiformigenes]
MGEKRLGNKAVAHIRKADGKKQTLEEHLLSVSGLTGTFARKIGLSQSGELAGGSHDFGKYAEAFRQYILSANGAIDPDSDEYIDPVSHKGKIDHSTAGAQYVRKRLVREKYPLYAQMMFLSICSHHSGLIDCLLPDGGNGFDKRLNKKEEDTHLAECESKADPAVKNLLASLSEEEILMEWYLKCRSIERREKKFAARAENPAAVSEEYENTRFFKKGLLLRCFFSCLLDADRIDSACFEDEQYKALRKRLGNPDWPKLAGHLEKALSAFSRESVIGRLRCDIADACYARSRSARGIYTLTVPTGGGKTLSSLRFAIHHAREHQLERIVYVIPYTSIIEQNAKVVRDILEKDEEPGTIVLEHHSNIEPVRETWQGKLLSSNWETPVVFTTMVQFLETLFGSGTASARRMHNLANAVLVFDEIQTLPIRCVHLFCHALNFLVEECGSSAVLCTATQPLLGNVPNPEKGQLRLADDPELMPDLTELFRQLQRVRFVDHTQSPMNLEQVGDLALSEQREKGDCLVIVNTKNWAAGLYRYCSEKNAKNVFHLSTSMCAAHRTAVLEEVRSLLAKKEPVLLVSTQLIECGVDISFRSVIRLAAGLDSILQAAGRCNRNMESDYGTVHIVRVVDGLENIRRLDDIREGRNVFLRVMDEYRERIQNGTGDLSDPDIIERYFSYYFHQRRDRMAYPCDLSGKKDTLLNLLGSNRKNVGGSQKGMLRQSFATVAKQFATIEAETQGILVPYGEGKDIIAQLCSLPSRDMAAQSLKRQLLKKAQRYSVNLYPDALRKLGNAVKSMEETGILYLLESHYDTETGITAEATGKMDFLHY